MNESIFLSFFILFSTILSSIFYALLEIARLKNKKYEMLADIFSYKFKFYIYVMNIVFPILLITLGEINIQSLIFILIFFNIVIGLLFFKLIEKNIKNR